MYMLVKLGGLDLNSYEGELKEGSREGFGTQYFPNGYKYNGQWQGNKANGQGKLEYTDGTFYEGVFKDNKIVEGLVSFYSGAKYVGKFISDERYKEAFHEGKFIFRNGDSFIGTWNAGVPKSGSLVTKDGQMFKFGEKEKTLLFDQNEPTSGKILFNSSTEIYEGGIKDKMHHGAGFFYSSFPHYEEVFYSGTKLDGRYSCNYIQGGYCYEGNYKNGERVGKWRYQTVKGFFYEGEPNFKNGTVTFPFLNDDSFRGDVEMQFQTITLLSGTYTIGDGLKKGTQIQITNVKSLSEIQEIKERKYSLERIKSRFKKSKVIADEPVLNGINVYHYPDGSYFKGNFNFDFIYIHKKDLLNCYFQPL